MKKLVLTLSVIFTLGMIADLIFEMTAGNQQVWAKAVGRVLMSLLPLLLLPVKNAPFKAQHVIGYYLLLLCTFVLGAIFHFYDRFSWWDFTLHVAGSIYVAFLALAAYRFYVVKAALDPIPLWICFLFVFSVATSLSAIWESIEFIGDKTVTSVMQRSGNEDTMTDMIGGLAGGILVGIYAVIKVKSLQKMKTS